jgi:O-antigen ligase
MQAALQVRKVSGRMLSALLLATRSSIWLLWVDIYPAVVAASLPWSTSAVAVFMTLWFFVLIPTLEPRSFFF